MPVSVQENIWIPLSDGTRLAARLWLPEGADAAPAPAVLEYIPYRKRDGTRGRDEPMHGWFAEQGYAAIRVDMRGSGDSDGHMADEYLAQEQDDAVEVIAWIAAQPWCTGAVGMMGKSWGGFNALQVAARRPPALKAIITVYSTDDRYNRRHPLPGWLPAHRQYLVGHDHAGLSGPAGRPGDRRRGLAQAVAGAAGPAALLPGAVAAAPALRRLLEARLDPRGLVGDPMPGAGRRRLGRQLHQRRAAPPGRAAGAAARHHRALGPHLPAGWRAGPGDRLPAGSPALVGPVAEGPRHRRDEGTDACAPSSRTGCRRPAPGPKARAAGSARRPGPARRSRRGAGR